MMDFSKIDSFIDALKEMRSIAELDRHLLHLLLEMKPDMSEATQKFLCLCFSLWDDGNTRVPLEAQEFLERWMRKWNGLLLLKETSDNAATSTAEIDNFEQIISSGIEEILGSSDSEFASIVSILETSEIDESAAATPLVLTRIAEECPYLYLNKHFRAKLLIEKYASALFKGGSDKVPSKKDVENIQTRIASIATYKKGEQCIPLQLNAEQAEAIIHGQHKNLIITGGPGTGKTTVILYILWYVLEKIIERAPKKNVEKNNAKNDSTQDVLSEYTIYLAAPSGKAADRMSESLKKGLEDISENLKETPIYAKLKYLEGMTIHRLLKYSRSDNGFSYNAKNHFPEKSIFVIDEASMVDVNLLSSLLQAIPSQDDGDLVTRLFILGDPYQLPSVDAGAVLGNILNSASKANYTAELKISMRFPPESEIGKLATAIKACADDKKKSAPNKTFELHPVFLKKDDDSAETPADEKKTTDEKKSEDAVYYYMLPQKSKDKSGEKLDKAPTKKEEQENVSKFLENWIGDFKDLPKLVAGIDPEVLENPSDELKDLCNAVWNKTLEKRILAAERRGAIGVEQINETIGNLIKGQKEKPKSNSRYFEGQLLILTQNQAMYRLYNGDTGIVLFKDSVPYIMLKKPNGKTGAEQRDFVAYPLSLLPADAVESAFAITIHKSQGSEYDHVTMFLPKEEGHPLLNNQILYTGITRAKKTVTIIATDKTFKAACETVIERDTGIEI